MLQTSGQLSMKDISREIKYKELPELSPMSCDYYFENLNDFEIAKEQMISQHNGNLSNITIGFGPTIEDINYIFGYGNYNKLTHAPKYIVGKNIKSIDYAFYDNQNITYVPEDIFIYLPSIRSASYCFAYSSNITSAIPEIWNKSKYPISNVTTHDFYATGCEKASNWNNIHTTYGGPSTGSINTEEVIKRISLNDSKVREIAYKIFPNSTIKLSDFYGKGAIIGEVYLVDTEEKNRSLWDDLYNKYGPDLSGIVIVTSNDIQHLNGGGNKGSLITATPTAIIGPSLKDVAFLFVNFTNLVRVSGTLFENCPLLETVQSTFDGCINANYIPELWDLKKYPRINNCTNYANRCTKAYNYMSIPNNWKGL